MAQAIFRFHGELNDFLPRKQRYQPVVYSFEWLASIKDMVEALGVPHCEIEMLAVNGESVDFSYHVRAGDAIDVFPRLPGPDNQTPILNHHRIALRTPYLGRPRFVLDIHLGRLSSYLRMMGFDTLWRNDYADEQLAAISNSEQRILLTRDVGLLKRSLVIHGYFVRKINARERLIEIMNRYDLYNLVVLFKHCMKCNGLLRSVSKESIAERIPPGAAAYFHEFHICESCDQIYWKGSHFDKMQALIAEVLQGTHRGLPAS